MRVSQAIASAQDRLEALGPDSVRLIQQGLDDIAVLVGDRSLRPSAARLQEIHRTADALLGYCATVDRPGLAEGLFRLCQMVDAVEASPLWLPETFDPLLATLALAVRGDLEEANIRLLLDGVDACIARYAATETPTHFLA